MGHGDDTPVFDLGCITPPLSPSKSISTEGWASPKTPGSPRKTKSCLFFRDIGTECVSAAPSGSPTKLSFAARLIALRSSDVCPSSRDWESSPAIDDCPVKQDYQEFNGSPLQRSVPIVRSESRPSPDPDVHSNRRIKSPSESVPIHNTAGHASLVRAKRSEDHCLASRKSLEASSSRPPTPVSPDAYATHTELLALRLHTQTSIQEYSPIKLGRLPLRHSSSPLRPSQWVTRGGHLSPQRSQTRTPDRFISSRRPLTSTRESFELNKPTHRLAAEEKTMRSDSSRADPFSRRLHRSGRLNDELRILRETHSVITERADLNRRAANLSLRRSSFAPRNRQVSAGAVWNVGGSSAVSDTVAAVSNGRGGMLGSGTNAPLYTSMFLSRSDPEAELEAYERRLALAFDVDQTDRILEHSTPPNSPVTAISSSGASPPVSQTKHVWKDNTWVKDGMTPLLDAPHMRDDYYCSLLAYSHTAKCLAVGLGNFVHLWSERKGVDTPESLNSISTTGTTATQHVTTLAFSSTLGGQAILAVGRGDGRIALWSPFDSEPRFDATQPKPISCVSFRPTVVKRPSLRDSALIVPTEELLVGDEAGHIYFYSVEWPNETDSALFGWHGAMTLIARMSIHTQQICGLSWSADGQQFATGGNDNACFLFETEKILQGSATDPSTSLDMHRGPNGESIWTVTPGHGPVLCIEAGREKHKWELNAAIKAIAFCPWQRGLLAVGGGSNDRCIHFYHTVSGACLATIDCAAQVTSLIWSTTRREIAATFGFAQPEHPFRVAVFAWPSCEQIVAIPWYDENRALFAIPYPGGPSMGRERGEGRHWNERTAAEGCIVVAASDSAIRFHEIWTGERRGLGSDVGGLGGSEILEGLHGVIREGEGIIR